MCRVQLMGEWLCGRVCLVDERRERRGSEVKGREGKGREGKEGS